MLVCHWFGGSRISPAEPQLWGLQGLNVVGLWSFSTVSDLEFHMLAFVEGLISRPGDLRVMHEEISAAVVGRDESDTFFAVELLHGALRHNRSFHPFGEAEPFALHD